MKKILIVLAFAAFSTAFAQENINEKTETTVTKTSVKDSKGVDVSTKAITETEKQSIAIEGQIDNVNFNTSLAPTTVNTSVRYNNEGTNYMFENHKKGYRMVALTDDTKDNFAVLKPTSKDGYYILSQKGDSSFGYFDKNGDFVVEYYDAVNDVMISTVYKIQVKEQTMVKKNKM
ncbi:MAG: hypothetical protein K8F54_01320 [Altibacter sp.]|uniref:hypothetical protein n=1 Tax=Altibacter sp. TaxID=2024823 RepID=UPI001DEA1A05|nr:hypothetical protein [Altibacter sp.]MBZ0326218.1 hypothetical protein [Altibacter sp.]